VPRPPSNKVISALLRNIFWRTTSPVASVAIRAGLSRQAVNKTLQHLINDGLVSVDRRKHRRRYFLVYTSQNHELDLRGPDANEDIIWKAFKPLLTDLPGETSDICHYGLTEMTNNSIDHSEGKRAIVTVSRTAVSLRMTVYDDGVGIFRKIAGALNLSDPRQSILELSKGKFTTDPSRHSGEGIFFTSRVFDRFLLRSSDLLFVHRFNNDDWRLRSKDRQIVGTRVTMDLLIPSERTLQQVTSEFSSGPDDYSFSKTHVPIKLARYGEDSLISRSSAKRVLFRHEKFSEVILDFAGVRTVGQGFADEIFRVFASEHSNVRIIPVNMNEAVTRMVERARAAFRDQSTSPPTSFE
jgi:anti-sigma regulatory factor (Ser/Thr protein kinase)